MTENEAKKGKLNDLKKGNLDRFRVMAKAFYENKILVFVRRDNGRLLENINGYIVEISHDFFTMTDIEEPEKMPQLIFFLDLEKKGSIFKQSEKGRKDEMR